MKDKQQSQETEQNCAQEIRTPRNTKAHYNQIILKTQIKIILKAAQGKKYTLIRE